MNSVFSYLSLIIFIILLIAAIMFLILIVRLVSKATRALDIYIQKNGSPKVYPQKEDKGHAIFNLEKLDMASRAEVEEEDGLESTNNEKQKEEKKYSTNLRKFHIIVGGIRNKDVESRSIEILGKFIPSAAIKMTEDGFIVEVPIQTIPAIIRSFTQKGISLYTVEPIEENGALQ